jgi:hypothetical protein
VKVFFFFSSHLVSTILLTLEEIQDYIKVSACVDFGPLAFVFNKARLVSTVWSFSLMVCFDCNLIFLKFTLSVDF